MRKPLLIEQLEDAIFGFIARHGEHCLSDSFLDFILAHTFARPREVCDICRHSYLWHAVGVFNGTFSHNFFHSEDFGDY